MIVERISAVTLKVTNMARSVHFYNEILGLEIIYGGPHASVHFSSNRRCTGCHSEPGAGGREQRLGTANLSRERR